MTSQAEIIKLNAYGKRWHVMIAGKPGMAYSGNTKRACRDYCRRHNLTIAVGR
jgi:hypothetical protein